MNANNYDDLTAKIARKIIETEDALLGLDETEFETRSRMEATIERLRETLSELTA